ncbi:MAG: cytochrome c biogenesis protein CcdA [Clostridia bacterium]|nr:cytochrome c biogenesis protein CcdA [Clostridia bacterium]
MIELLNNFSSVINTNIFLAIAIALIGGFLSSFSPCTLSTLPIIIGYTTSNDENKKGKNYLYSIFFAIGLTITFVVIGIATTLLNIQLKLFGTWWYLILAIILVIVTLNLLGIFGKNNKTCKRPKLKKNFLGAFLLGIVGGFFDSPCSTPILIIILTFIAQSSNLLFGIILMIAYSIGHSVVIILAGSSADFITKLSESEKYAKLGKVARYVFALFSFALALYLFYLAF